MSNGIVAHPVIHTFSRSDIHFAEHEFARQITKYFGEVWKLPWNAEYKGVSWDCRSMLVLDVGLWTLCQKAIHKGAIRAAGRLEVRDVNTMLRFILFYDFEHEKDKKKVIV